MSWLLFFGLGSLGAMLAVTVWQYDNNSLENALFNEHDESYPLDLSLHNLVSYNVFRFANKLLILS